jgi:hypothetical protein
MIVRPMSKLSSAETERLRADPLTGGERTGNRRPCLASRGLQPSSEGGGDGQREISHGDEHTVPVSAGNTVAEEACRAGVRGPASAPTFLLKGASTGVPTEEGAEP